MVDLVTSSGAGLGVVFTPGGEQVTVVDDRGRVLSDDQLLLALIELRRPSLDGGRVALPVSATGRAAALVEELGGGVELVPTSPAAIMAAAADPFVFMAADTEGRFAVPAFLPAFDAPATFATLLDLIAASGRSLSDVVDELPEVHMATREVVTPWEQKGAVMRTLVEQAKGRDVDLVDGIRIHHDGGWALVLPDPEEPLTRVIAEADGDEQASRLADEYARPHRAARAGLTGAAGPGSNPGRRDRLGSAA